MGRTSDERLTESLRRELAVRGIDYEWLGESLERSLVRLTITLGSRDDRDAELDWIAYFERGSHEPVLMSSCARGPRSPRLDVLAGRIARAPAYQRMACSAPDGIIRSTARTPRQ